MDFLDDMELDMLAAYVSATQAAEANEAEKHKVRGCCKVQSLG